MINLFNANFEIIKRSKYKYLFLLPVLAAVFVIILNFFVTKSSGSFIYIDELTLSVGVAIGLLSSIIANFFICSDYSNGTIRNKIIAGHSKIRIYLVNLITLFITGILLYFIYVLTIVLSGIFLFDGLAFDGIGNYIYSLFKMVFILMSFISIFTFIAFLVKNAAVGITISIFLIIFTSIMNNFLLNQLYEEETRIRHVPNEYGEFVEYEEKNPYYIKNKNVRILYSTIITLTPVGQSNEIPAIDAHIMVNKKLLPLYQLADIIIFTGIGLLIFKNKDIN